jgi:hypothetical protein
VSKVGLELAQTSVPVLVSEQQLARVELGRRWTGIGCTFGSLLRRTFVSCSLQCAT